MNEQSSEPDSTEATATNSCKKIDQLLKDVNREINRLDALNLKELKTELEAFVEIKKTASTEYKKEKYDELKSKWCAEGKKIEQIHADLTCSYGNNWKKLINDTVCAILKTIQLWEDTITNTNCKGEKEKARDEAKKQLDAAEANLNAWKIAPQKIEEMLTTNEGWITEIQSLSQREDSAFRLYLLWFKLLPAHNNLRPDGEKPLYLDETPEALCEKVVQQGPNGAYKSQESHSNSQSSQGKLEDNPCDEPAREAPWIINPNSYMDKLDRAFCCYKLKKELYADAKATFQSDLDSLASLTEKLVQAKSTLDADIKAKLVEATKPKSTDDQCA